MTSQQRIRLARRHATWALGWGDEVWWSRLAHPEQHSWRDTPTPLRLQALDSPKTDRDPKALACYGLLVRHQPACPEQLLLRFAPHHDVVLYGLLGGRVALPAGSQHEDWKHQGRNTHLPLLQAANADADD